MQAHDIMTPDVIAVQPDTPLAEVAELMLIHRISGLPVVEDGAVVGMVSEGDLLRRAELGTAPARPRWLTLFAAGDRAAEAFVRTHGRTAGEVMSQALVAVAPETPVEEIAALMETHRVKRLPVVRGGQLVGIVTRADLLRALAARLGQGAGTSAGVPASPEDDRRIRAALLAGLRTEAWAPSPAALTVQVQGGVVHLWGTIRSDAQRRAVVAAAESTEGVRRVADHLQVWHDPDPLDRPGWLTSPPP